MNPNNSLFIQGIVVEEQNSLTVDELCRACDTEVAHVRLWVTEGVLEPIGESPDDWRFVGESLRRARLAQRLSIDLEINPPGVALALDLLDQIAALKAQLRRTNL